jgi:hypothetical protein
VHYLLGSHPRSLSLSFNRGGGARAERACPRVYVRLALKNVYGRAFFFILFFFFNVLSSA